jgi:hypothetical protein
MRSPVSQALFQIRSTGTVRVFICETAVYSSRRGWSKNQEHLDPGSKPHFRSSILISPHYCLFLSIFSQYSIHYLNLVHRDLRGLGEGSTHSIPSDPHKTYDIDFSFIKEKSPSVTTPFFPIRLPPETGSIIIRLQPRTENQKEIHGNSFLTSRDFEFCGQTKTTATTHSFKQATDHKI